MDEKDFKKHLRDLVHGKHNPAEHDWGPDASSSGKAKPRRAARKKTAKRSR